MEICPEGAGESLGIQALCGEWEGIDAESAVGWMNACGGVRLDRDLH